MSKRYVELTEEQKTIIFEQMEKGLSLRKICEWNRIDYHSVTQCIRENDDFAQQYARSREIQADYVAAESIELLDEQPVVKKDQFGNESIDPAWVQLQAKRSEGRRWYAGKLKPKIYGDSTTLKGDADNPLIGFAGALDAVAARIASYDAKRLENAQEPVIIDVTAEESPI